MCVCVCVRGAATSGHGSAPNKGAAAILVCVCVRVCLSVSVCVCLDGERANDACLPGAVCVCVCVCVECPKVRARQGAAAPPGVVRMRRVRGAKRVVVLSSLVLGFW